MADSAQKKKGNGSRQDRLAAALRQNLRRRKTQAKGRQETGEEPAPKKDGDN